MSSVVSSSASSATTSFGVAVSPVGIAIQQAVAKLKEIRIQKAIKNAIETLDILIFIHIDNK